MAVLRRLPTSLPRSLPRPYRMEATVPRNHAPISLRQLGETLGLSLATVNRSLAELRANGTADLRNGRIIIREWEMLSDIGQFQPSYLHLRKPLSL